MINNVRWIAIFVSDLKTVVDFYRKTLGLNKKYEYPSYAGFQYGGVEIGLRPCRKKRGYIEDAPSIEFFVDDVDSAYEALKKKGVSFVKELHDEPWGGREASFLDPDGNLLGIVQIRWEKYFEVSVKGAKAP